MIDCLVDLRRAEILSNIKQTGLGRSRLRYIRKQKDYRHVWNYWGKHRDIRYINLHGWQTSVDSSKKFSEDF